MNIYIGDLSQFYSTGLDEQEETTVFCPNGHAARKIPVYFNLRWKCFTPVEAKDMKCPVCFEECEY